MYFRSSSVEIYLFKYLLCHFKFSCCILYNVLVTSFQSLHPSSSQLPTNIFHLLSGLFYNSLSLITGIHMPIYMKGIAQNKQLTNILPLSEKNVCPTLKGCQLPLTPQPGLGHREFLPHSVYFSLLTSLGWSLLSLFSQLMSAHGFFILPTHPRTFF